MPWYEIFAVFLICHLVGDFALQTSFQAEHKRGGLGGDPLARRALLNHVTVYALAFVPAFVWLWSEAGALVPVLAALLFLTHLVEDDGRLLDRYIQLVKRTDPAEHPMVTVAVDQTFHACCSASRCSPPPEPDQSQPRSSATRMASRRLCTSSFCMIDER